MTADGASLRRSASRSHDAHPRVFFLFLLLIVITFVLDALAMRALAALPTVSRWFGELADPLVLTPILAPVLWLLMVMPLRKAAEQSQVMLRTAFDGFWILDKRGRFLDVNATYCQLIGYTRDELLTMEIPDLEAAESPAATEAHIATVLQTGSDRFVTRHRRKDGEILDVEVSVNYLPRHGGRFFVFVRDITKTRRLQTALHEANQTLEGRVARRTAELETTNTMLRQSEDQYRDLVEHSHDLICTHDLSGRLLSVNEAAIKALGHPREALLGKNLHELLDADARPAVDAYLREIGTTGRAQGAMRVRSATGELRYWEYDNTLRRDGLDGAVVRGMARDVTDRRRSEASLRLQSVALNAAANAIVITNREGTIEWVNKAFVDSTGYSVDEAIGKNPGELVKSGLHDRTMYSHLWETILSGRVWHGELTNRRKDGTLYPEEQTITPVKDARGTITHFIAIKRDLTQQHLLEAQYRQAQKMESVGRLAGGIAHDFNNLLTVITGTAGLALSTVREEDPLRADLVHIQQAGDRAAALTRQLLAFSRKQILKQEVLSVGTLVAGLRGMLQRLIGEDISLVCVPSGPVGCVLADPGQVEQVVLNLAVNARDAMPTGGTLTIEVKDVDVDEAYAAEHPSVPAGAHVMLAVADTGVGMDEAVRQRIFEPFFTTKEPGKGTGLGLATVYGIVQQSGGSIWVTSEVGSGSSFQIYLPRVEEVAPSVRPARPAPTVTGTETILVVEDEEALLHITTRILRSAGYTVLTAGSGEEALGLLEQCEGPVHLLLTDVVMPGMSGRDLASRLTGTHPEIKVLYVSGHTDDTILRHGVIAKTMHLISKPYSTETLTGQVRAVLDGTE